MMVKKQSLSNLDFCLIVSGVFDTSIFTDSEEGIF